MGGSTKIYIIYKKAKNVGYNKNIKFYHEQILSKYILLLSKYFNNLIFKRRNDAYPNFTYNMAK